MINEDFAKELETALDRELPAAPGKLKLTAVPKPDSSLDGKVETFERARAALHLEIERDLAEALERMQKEIDEHRRQVEVLEERMTELRRDRFGLTQRVG